MIAWAAVKLFLGGALKRAVGAFSALLGWVGRYPWQAACLALLLAAGWQTRGKSNALDKLAAQELAHAAYVEQIEAASAANAAAALAQVKAVEAKSAQLAKDADHAHELALQDARTATDRFIAANRVRPRAAGSCPAPAAAENNPAPSDNGPGEAPELVAVSREDFDTLTENTIRLHSVHEWGESLIKSGLAKPTFPEPAYGTPDAGQ